MKGLMIENNMETTSPLQKKSLSSASNLAITIPKGFQGNLLFNSLTTKLKQRRSDNNKENAPRIISAKPPKQARKSSTCLGSKKEHSALGFNDHTDSNAPRSGSAYRTGSGVSDSFHVDLKKDGGQPRIDSAASDKLPRLSSKRDNRSSQSSRRTASADPFIGVGSGSVMSGRISVSTSFYPSSESPGLIFEPTSADHTIKVIKRDGVFQPIDKYAPGRHGRDFDQGCRGVACDYELFTLPLCEDATTTSVGKHTFPVSRGKSDISKKSMKVSWCNVNEHENLRNVIDIANNKLDSNSTPVDPITTSRTNSKDNMAFKRPIYFSGKSGIKSIGVKWTIPTVAPEEEEVQRQLPSAGSSASSKPMWSWLVTSEPINKNEQMQKQRKSARVKSVGQLSRASKSKESPTPSSLGRSASMFDIRTQHCRDVHPVATAMDRQGTSVTKTKWHVPSSTSSTLNAKQVAMDRLQMVKRPGKKIVYEVGVDEFGGVLKFQNEDDGANPEQEYIDEYKEMLMMNQMKETDDGITTTTTTRDDTNSSPTKSISTFH